MRACLVYTAQPETTDQQAETASQVLISSLEAFDVTLEVLKLPLATPATWASKVLMQDIADLAASETMQQAWHNALAQMKSTKGKKPDYLMIDMRRSGNALPLGLLGFVRAATNSKFSRWRVLVLTGKRDIPLARRLLKVPESDLPRLVATTPEEMHKLLLGRRSAHRLAAQVAFDQDRMERRYGSRYIDDFD